MDVVAHSNAVVGHHNGTRSLSVVETAGISRPSTREPHISESRRVRVCGSFDARVAMLEVVFVTTTLEFGRQTTPAREQPNEAVTGSARDQGRSRRDPTIPNLVFFDDVDLEESFAVQVPMLKNARTFSEGGCATVSGSRWRSVTGQKEKVLSWQSDALGRSSHCCP